MAQGLSVCATVSYCYILSKTMEKLDNPYIHYDSGYSISWEDIIEKINELVEAVNQLEKKIEKLQVI